MTSASLAPTMRGTSPSVVRRDVDWSHQVDDLRELSTGAVRTAFPPERLKRFRRLGSWFSYHGLSRARRGINCPAGRIVTWFAALRAIGAPRWTAQLLVDALQDAVDQLWPGGEIEPAAALIAEQEAESAADPLEARYLNGDRSVRGELIAVKRIEIARDRSALAELEAEELACAGGLR